MVNQGGSWIKLWDAAMDLGTHHTDGLKALARMLAHHQRGPKPCPLCEESNFNLSPIDHLLGQHQRELNLDKDNFHAADQLLTHLVEGDIKFVYKSVRETFSEPPLNLGFYCAFVLCLCPFVHCIIVPHVGLYQ